MNVVKFLAIGSLLAALSGCASYPISKEYRDQAREITLDQVKADPYGTRGQTVIWGGRIINVVNETNSSAIYILCLPAGEDERPIPDAPSPGRFIAVNHGFLDPEMFPQGSLITVAGQLGGIRTEPLQNYQYTYPVVQIEETHIWPREEYYPDYDYYPYYGYYPPYWGWGWWGGPGWWWWGRPYYYYGGFHGGYRGGYYGGFRGGAVRGGASFQGGGRSVGGGGAVSGGHSSGGGGGGSGGAHR